MNTIGSIVDGTTPWGVQEPPAPASDGQAVSDEELLDAYSRAVVGVVEKVGPAVVSIRVKKKRPSGHGRNGGQPRDGEGAGSGVIITPDGFVLTNNHVVEGASEVEINLTDGNSYRAQVVG